MRLSRLLSSCFQTICSSALGGKQDLTEDFRIPTQLGVHFPPGWPSKPPKTAYTYISLYTSKHYCCLKLDTARAPPFKSLRRASSAAPFPIMTAFTWLPPSVPTQWRANRRRSAASISQQNRAPRKTPWSSGTGSWQAAKFPALGTAGRQMMQNIHRQTAQRSSFAREKRGLEVIYNADAIDGRPERYLSPPLSLICPTLILQRRSIKLQCTVDFVLACLVTRTRTHAVSRG